MGTSDARYRVVRAFLDRRSERSGNFFSNGDALYTYRVRLADWGDNGIVRYTQAMGKKFSVTSSAHQRAIRDVLGERPLQPE